MSDSDEPQDLSDGSSSDGGGGGGGGGGDGCDDEAIALAVVQQALESANEAIAEEAQARPTARHCRRGKDS